MDTPGGRRRAAVSLLAGGGHEPGAGGWRERLFVIIFEADTPLGKLFDVALIFLILVSVVAVMLASVADINARYGDLLRMAEWGFTVLFTIEYCLRIVCVRRPLAYLISFYGLVDLLAILPTYLELVLTGATALLVTRVLRLLRVFRVLKLTRYVGEASALVEALHHSARKIFVFVLTVLSIVIVVGALMYLVEGAEHGFTSIPKAVYWAVVTVTTVGYGDLSPQTPLGQILATVLMLIGYGIIAVPTGIYAAEISHVMSRRRDARVCPACHTAGHEEAARFCWHCGAQL